MSKNRTEIDHPMAGKARSTKMTGIAGALEKVNEMKAEDERIEASPKPKQHFSSLKDLLVFGKVTETIDLNGISITLSTLTNKQQKNLVTRLMKLENEDRLLNAKTFTLGEAVISINGINLEELCDSDLDLSIEQKKVEVISEMQFTLVDLLYDKYEELVKKSNSCYKTESVSDDIKN